ncbi:MAG TPA: A24 family peptidase [Dehalococcoidia bacterium]|nr:A24 family peptidase [Dehalococcoidia bacterium]
MEPLLFFLFGLPAAFAANRLIVQLTDFEEDDEAEIESETEGRLAARQLPWQRGPWPDRVRLLSVASLPVLAAIAGWRFDPLQAVAVSLLVLALIVCTATDLLRYRVPNAVTYPGVILALAATLVMPDADFVMAVAAAALGGFFFLFMAVVTRGGMGLGDVKLAVLIGAGLGLPAAYQALAIGVVVGGLVILALFVAGVVGRRQAVPYAPFLALTAVVVVLTQGAAFAPL